MTKDTLRNEIEKIQLDLVEKTANPTTKWEDVIPEATSQILSLLEGILDKTVLTPDKIQLIPPGTSRDYGLYCDGFNACLQEIKEKLK